MEVEISPTNQTVIRAQQDQLRTMFELHVGTGSEYALLDFPNHGNVGDSAIWLGEIAELRAITGRPPSYVCTEASFDLDEFQKACPTGIVFLHGGGNLGNLWEKHQRLREHVLQNVRDRTIVQLPQSISFSDRAEADKFKSVVRSNGEYILYVRDRKSVEFSLNVLDHEAALVPDSAFALGGQALRAEPDKEVLMLMRTDHEAVAERYEFGEIPEKVVLDWNKEPSSYSEDKLKRMKILAILLGKLNKVSRQTYYFNSFAKDRVERGLSFISQGRYFVTDRLHGHILATLLDIPHVALDNNYGKISGYIEEWTKDYVKLRTSKSSTEAVSMLKELRARF